MAKKHLKADAHFVRQGCWWYEENGGVSVIVEHSDKNDVFIKTEHYKIPWSSIRAALKRKDMK